MRIFKVSVQNGLSTLISALHAIAEASFGPAIVPILTVIALHAVRRTKA